MQKAKLFLSLLILAGFSICAQSGVTVVDSFISGSIYRSYRLYKPTSYTGSTAYPLVLNFHGYTSNALSQQYYGNFMPVADTAKFLVVHPQGTKDGTGNPYWNAGISIAGANDLQFVSDLIDSLKLLYNIDPNAIYSTGLSNGGFMSNYLACNLSSKIAAIASVSGTMFNTWSGSCNPPRPVPAMHIHGTADGTVPYNGGSGMIAADSVVSIWRAHNNCNSVPSFTNIPDAVPTDGATATRYLYVGGNSGSADEFYKVNNGGHTWPGASIIIGTTCEDFNASVEIWRFFRKYKLNLLTNVKTYDAFSAGYTIYPNPSSGKVFIDSYETISVSVFNLVGSEVLPASNSKSIDISGLPAGIYFFRIASGKNHFTAKIIKQ
jgi:polyhydroxybutyrate depolymerase